MKYILHSDGGARGNPGPAGCGFLIQDEHNNILFEGSKYIGETTNNQAEYQALYLGLEKIKELSDSKVETIDCYLDSELVVKQLKKEYKMKNPELRVWFDKVNLINMQLGNCLHFHHIMREQNKKADQLANEAMDKKT